MRAVFFCFTFALLVLTVTSTASAADRTSSKVSQIGDQTIPITKAAEIDEHQRVVTDIYAAVVTQDWSFATIPSGHSIRVTFAEILNRTNDLTLYAKASDPQRPVRVTVFPVYVDGDENQRQGSPLATTSDGLHPDFHRIGSEIRYRVLLSNLATPTDTFDLRIDGGSLDADFIVDPVGWYNVSWTYRKSITIDHTKVGNGTEDETNFPVLISLTGLTNINANGSDIRFTAGDGTTELPREIESYAGGTLVAWVKVPTLSYTVDTVIYMYFGNAGASEPAANSAYGSQNVWDANYKGVWHLPDGTTLSGSDSTSNANNGTPTSVLATTGNIDGAASFNGSSSVISVGGSPFYFSYTDLFSVEAWINTTSISGSAVIVAVRGVFDAFGYGVYRTNNKIVFFYYSSWPNGIVQRSSSAVLTTNTWIHVAAVRDALTTDGYKIYINGALDTGTLDYSEPPNSTPNYSSKPLYIGSYAGTNDRFSGSMEEIRISSAARSAGWIKTVHNNQNSPSTFYSVGGPEINLVVTLSTPADSAGHTLNVRPSLVWMVPYKTGGGTLDFRVTVDGSQIADSASNWTQFEYLSSGVWTTLVSANTVPAETALEDVGNHKVRWRPPTPLSVAAHTWKVCAVADGTPGPDSAVRNFTIADITLFGADLTANGSILAADINLIRTETNLARAFRGLGATEWAETITAKVTHVKKAHLEELRTALTPIFDEAGYIKHGTKPNSISPDTEANFYSEALTQYVTPIKAIHFQRIRDALGGF